MQISLNSEPEYSSEGVIRDANPDAETDFPASVFLFLFLNFETELGAFNSDVIYLDGQIVQWPFYGEALTKQDDNISIEIFGVNDSVKAEILDVSLTLNDSTIGEKTKGKPAKDENKTSPGKEKKESRGLITGDLIWPYNADGSRMIDEEAMAYWGASGYNELAIENAIAVREADRINGVDPPEQIEPDMVTTPPLKEPKGKGPKGVEQQGVLTPSGNYLPPIKQMKMGITPQEVLCNEGMELIFKSTDGSPVCVSMVAAEKLVARGWATR